MKLRTIIENREVISKLLSSSLPIKIAWDLKKFIKTIKPEIESFDEIKETKVREYGEEELENGIPTGIIRVLEENMKDFLKIMDELMDTEIDVEIPEIKINYLLEYRDVNNKPISITPAELMKLDWLIVE